MKIKRKFKNFLNVFALLIIFFFSFAVFRGTLKNQNAFDKIPLIQDFQKVGIGPAKLYVYSAYFHTAGTNSAEGTVTILAGLRMRDQNPLFCKLYLSDGNHILTIKSELKPLSADNISAEKPYVAYYIICNVSRNLPTFVSVVESENGSATNFLRIKYKTRNEKKFNFALCVQPVFNYENPLRFAEFIEFYKMMGVGKFTFYNQSIGRDTSCLMKSYGDLVEILPWTCPYVAEVEIRVYGQFIAQNECLHRYKGISKYLIIVDLDEFIMPSPSVGNNYYEMIESLNEYVVKNQSLEEISGYSFRNGFFFPESDSIDSKFLSQLSPLFVKNKSPQFQVGLIFNQLHIFKKTLRAKYLENHGERSKYIVLPDRVIEVASHAIIESVGKSRPVFIPENLAYSHHYRDCEEHIGHGIYFNWCRGKVKTVESSGQRFAEEISENISNRLNSESRHCHIDINIYPESNKSKIIFL